MLRCLFRRCLAPVLAPVACRRRPRAPAETFTSKTMLRCLFRRCLAPVLAPVACRRRPVPVLAPVACRRRLRAPAETFTSKTMLRCLFRRCLAPVLAPVACRRPPRRLRPVILMVKHSTLATRDVTFPIVLRIPIYIDGETRHFGDIGRRFFDSVANSKNGISGYAVNYRPGRHP